MKRILIYIAIVALCFGCSERNDLETHFQKDTCLKIKAVSVKTLNNGEDEFITTDGSAIGVFVDANEGYKAYSNFRYTLKGNQWVEDDVNDKIHASYGPVTVRAYYPYGSTGITNTTDITKVQLTSQKYTIEADLCYSRNMELVSLETVGFTLSHAYACFTFNIIKDPNYVGDGAIDLVQMLQDQFPNSGELNMKTYSYANVKTEGSDFNPEITSLSTTTPTKISYLMVPSVSDMAGFDFDGSQVVPIFFKVDGKYMAIYIPLTSFAPSNRIEANTNYIINVVVKPMGINIAGIQKNAWTEKNLGTFSTGFAPVG